MAAATTGKKLYECPTNVKEALDWLEALGRNANDCATVIKQQGKEIIKDFNGNVDDVCQKAREFSSAIKKNGGSAQQTYKADGWTTMCQNAAGSGGGKCCGSGGKGGCSNCSNPSSCNGCCAKCPKQICARIFCLIVPVLRNVLMYLYDKCNNNNKRKQPQDQDKWTGKITDNDIGKFFTECGFNKDTDLNGSTEVNGILSSLINLGGALNSVYTAISNALGQADSNTFLQGATTVPVARTPSQAPNSICDLLLWLQFLPYSTNYNQVITKLKVHIPESVKINQQTIDTLLKDFTSSIPMLFLFIEGKGKEQNKGSSIFQHIATLAKCQYVYEDKYYKKPEDVVKMLVSAMPVLYWSIDQMKDKCTQGDNCQQSVKECDKMWKFLSLMGWKKDSSDSDHNIEGNMKCSLFKKYIEKELVGDQDKSARLKEIKTAIENAWKGINGAAAASSGSSASSGSYLPKTIYEMLIWLMGLPVSEKFKDLKTQIKGLNGGSGGVSLDTVMPQFTEILFQVPHLFLALNGDLSGMLNGLFQCHGISEPSKAYQYGTDGTTCLKIFSAIVAILFPVIRYLQQRCKNDSVFKNGESWSTKETNADGLKTYLNFAGFQPISSSGMNGQQFHSGVLQPIFGDLTGQNGGAEKLKKLYDCAQKGIQQTSSSTTGSHTPSTIRQMMLWLIGLPVTKEYGNNGSGLIQTVTTKAQQINDLKNKITNGQSTSFQHQLHHSIVGMMTVISQIEGGLKSVVEFLKEGFKDGSKFKYDGFNGDESLLKVFSSYVTSVHVQLRFLKVMCGRQKDQGGWQECTYANGTCNCKSTLKISCLKDFLQNGNNGASGSGDNKFKLMNGSSEHLKMGFKAYTPNQSGITGDNIHIHLEHMLDPIPKTPSSGTVEFKKPLSLLTQYCVAIGKMDPVSLGDHFDVFRELASDGMWSKIETQVKESVKEITKDDGQGDTAGNALKGALTAVWPSSHNGGAHDGDLVSLTGCNGGSPNTCPPFIASLSHGLYNFFDPSKLDSPANKIDWLYMKMSALYGKLVTLKTEMTDNCKCCPEGEAQSSSDCPGITQCPQCLPQLYKMGLVFGDTQELSVKSGAKKCRDLHTVMDKVLVATTSKLCVVFTSIETGRFKPYLLFASHVVKGKKDQLTVTGDENYNCYTHALGGEYKDTYLEVKKKELEKTAQENKSAREGALKCTCTKHEYSELKVTPKNPIIVTLTLYFKSTHITQTISLTVPFHGPAFNPLVRLYPRNLKSIVDWLLRIGQTRLGQDGSGASTNDTGLKEMCDNLWPKIQECLNAKDQDVFKALVEGVIKLMGLKTQGKQEVGEEVTEAYNKAKQNIQKKLNGGNGEEGFQQTFKSILTFKPKEYIDKVIDDFGKRVCTVKEASGSSKQRDFNCIAKAVSTCMSTALKEIQKLAGDNKEALTNYNVKHIEGLETINDTVSTLNDLSTVEKLFKCFKTFFTSYENVLKVLGSGLQQAQDDNNDRKTLWEAIQKYTGAFYYVSEVSTHVKRLERDSTMGGSYDSLEILIQKLTELERHNGSLNGDGDKVTQFIKKVQDKLTEIGKENIEKALNMKNGGTKFEDVVKMFLSTVLSRYPNNANVIDKIFYHLPVFSECLKAMVEIYNTGMKEFIKELKTCLETAKGHINKIHMLQIQLKELKDRISSIKDGTKDNYKDDGMTFILQKTVESIKELLSNHYIYQTQSIIKEQINNSTAMTTYLKSLPDLIRDRYVLQKWNDKPEDFCGVQRFENGIVKGSDINGITTVLQDLLRDTFHDQTTYCVTIHEFQVRALIYNFCHKEAMEQTGSGVMLLYHINYHINGAQGTPQSQASLQWTNIKDKKEKLSPLLTKLSDNAYLRYFATHLRDSVGYHTLSNTLGALEKVKEKLKESNGSSQPDKWNEFKDLLQKTAIDELYNRLSSLLDKLHREYIFEYPPFDWQKSCQKLMRKQDEAEKAAQTGRQRRSTDAQAAPSPKATTPNTCEMCVPSMAHIFVGFVPQMYRLFKMLREIAQKEKQSKSDTLLNADNVQDILTKTLTVAGFFECEGWRLKLGSDMTKDVEVFPFDLEHSKTGDDLCKFLDDIITDKEPGALVAQGEASTTDSLKPLDKLFQAVMQHFRKKRDELRKKREKALEDEFNKKHKDSGLTFQAPPAPLPSTVRQVLFWLHEMDTNKAFYDQMSQHIEALCHQSSIDITPSTILHVLKLSITQCLEVLATIEDPGRQNADYYYELYTEEHYYDYPVTNIPLFFYTFVEKLMAAFLELNFVCVQCEFTGKQGGWKDCHIGKSEHSMEGQNCRCTKSHTTVSSVIRVSVEGSVVCPRPLSAFLFSDPKNQLRIPSDVSQRLAYMSKGTMPCGFQLKNKASTDAATPGDAHTHTPLPTSVTGSVLVEPLRKLVGGHVTGRLNDTSTRNDENNTLSTVIYLRDLLRYVLCLAVRPPWSMSENMAFFYRVTESWKKDNNVVGVRSVALRNDNLLGAIHAEIDMFPGTFNGKKLTSAVERFAGIEDNKHQKTNGTASNMSHQYDLRTLMGCQELNTSGTIGATVQCSPFMFPLSLDVYTHFDERNSRAYLSWILNFAFGIYGQLKALEEMIKGSACVRNASQSKSDCPSLPTCPGVLTALYQSGSSFMDQGRLAEKENGTGGTNTTKKRCNDFHTVLSGLFNCNTASCSPLHNLIVQCEAFLWSIRMPFSLVQLSLWSVAILFISYVFVVPLDHFKIKSHLFNRLKYTMHPSLLIADGQRRVSEVAYFSL